MSHRRLVKRTQIHHDESSQDLESRPQKQTEKSAAKLPQYKPPCFPLTEDAKRKLEELYLHHDFTKYKKNIKEANSAITKAAYDCNDRLWQRKQKLQSLEEKINTSENLSKELEARYEVEKNYTHDLEKKVEDITIKSEKALRDLIDYGDELSMYSHFMQEVSEKAADKTVPASTLVHDQESGRENSSQEKSISEQSAVKCVEFLKAAKVRYKSLYENKSLRERYADHNDYKNFKGMVHDAKNQGPNARPLENPKYWFPEESSQSEVPGGNQTNEDDVDDEIVMTSATTNLKCSLTLQYFDEPFSNRKCNHIYEKSAILDYLNTEGTVYSQPGRRGQPRGNKKILCPTPGCSVALEQDDFFLDERIRQQVINAKRFEATGDQADDSDENEPDSE